jgi:hypothetical protein
MKRNAIIFIAWKACERNSRFFDKNPFQYENALFLILLTGGIHMLQVLLLINFFSLFKRTTIDGLGYIILFISLIALFLVCRNAFSRRVLSEANELYEGSKMGKYAKLIAYPYLIINLTLLTAIAIWRMK